MEIRTAGQMIFWPAVLKRHGMQCRDRGHSPGPVLL